MLDHLRPNLRGALSRQFLSHARSAAAALALVGYACTLTACTGPEEVMFNKMYTADYGQVTVVDNEELTRLNRMKNDDEETTTNDSMIMRFSDEGKMRLFFLGGQAIAGTYEVKSASDDGLQVAVHINDDRFDNGTAKVEPDGSAFELEIDAPIVGYRAGEFKDEHSMEPQTHKVQLSFVAQAD